VSAREDCLQQAQRLVTTDRAADYGDLQANARLVADLLALIPLTGEAVDYPMTMILVKVARLVQNPGHRDPCTDLAGYAALGYELGPITTVTRVVMDDGKPFHDEGAR